MGLPKWIAEEYHRRGARMLLRGVEVAPEERANANRRKKSRRDGIAADVFGLGDAGKIETDLVSRGHLRKCAARAAPIEEVRIRYADRANFRRGFVEHHQTRCVLIWQRAQQNGVEHRENRGGRADGQGQG